MKRRLTILTPCACACGALQLCGNWVELETHDGDVYFANIVTKETSWDMPAEAEEEAGDKENAVPEAAVMSHAPHKQERVMERCALIFARPSPTIHTYIGSHLHLYIYILGSHLEISSLLVRCAYKYSCILSRNPLRRDRTRACAADRRCRWAGAATTRMVRAFTPTLSMRLRQASPPRTHQTHACLHVPQLAHVGDAEAWSE